jgi:serine protease
MTSRKIWMLASCALGLTAGSTAWRCFVGSPPGHQVSLEPTQNDDSGLAAGSLLASAVPGAGQGQDAGGPGVALIVDYRDDVTDAELIATPEDEHPISRWSSLDRVYRVTFRSVAEAEGARQRLAHDPRVESVDWDVQAAIPPDEQFQESSAMNDRSMQAECSAKVAVTDASRTGFPSDPCYRYQWHLQQIGLPEAWELGQGKGAVVAVIDTGVSRVPDLAETTFVPGYNFINDTDDARDDHGHGTHVAGTIAQSTNNKLGVGGVAFGASIMPLKVLSARGSGSMAAIGQAIRFAADHGANVINMSLGGPFPVATIAKAVKYAREKGVTVVAAAGNDGRGRVSYPARYPGVIAVAATQFDETTTFYSNWGAEVDIAAPGGNVRVDQNGDGKPDGVLQNTIVPGNIGTTDYLWFMGTSMAAPHVAGVAALIVGAGVRQPDAVEKILLESARAPKGRTPDKSAGAMVSGDGGTRDPHYGAGVVDASAALKRVLGRRGISELGLGASLTLLGLGWVSRSRGPRGRVAGSGGGRTIGFGFLATLVLGASGLFVVPFLFHVKGMASSGPWGLLTGNVLSSIDAHLPAMLQGNPVLWSALLPVAAVALFYGIRRLRGLLAGLTFGIGGALLFAAIAMPSTLTMFPTFLDRPWLLANAALCALLGTAALRRD